MKGLSLHDVWEENVESGHYEQTANAMKFMLIESWQSSVQCAFHWLSLSIYWRP